MKIQRPTEAAEIPTSSMADIAFLLIIFFMLTLSFTVSRGLDFALPKETDQIDVEPIDSVLIEILTDGSLIVDRKPLALNGLLEYLRPKLEQAPEKPVILKPSPSTPYGHAVAVLDELRLGRERLGLDKDIVIALPTSREIEQLWR